MSRICYLADASSIHTRRWVSHFAGQGYEVHVLSFLPGEIPGAAVHLLDAGSVQAEGGNWRYLLRLPDVRRYVRRLQPDLVHGHYVTSYGLLGALAGCRPLVLTAWGSDVLVTPRRSRIYRALLRFTLGRADLVTSDAEMMSEEILRYGLPADRLLTVPLGVDLRLFNSQGRDWPESGLRLISTRHLVPNTNLDTVLFALARVRNKLPGLHLNVLGDGPERPKLEALADKLGLDDAITWRGAAPHEQLPPQLREADLYLALTHSDSTSVSLLEAMACGVFPIVSDLPANREWITPGLNGLLVSLGNIQALAEALDHAAHVPALRRQAARHNTTLIAEQANWEANMAQVEEAYRTLIAGRGRR